VKKRFTSTVGHLRSVQLGGSKSFSCSFFKKGVLLSSFTLGIHLFCLLLYVGIVAFVDYRVVLLASLENTKILC
jgi:hypothetical protein